MAKKETIFFNWQAKIEMRMKAPASKRQNVDRCNRRGNAEMVES